MKALLRSRGVVRSASLMALAAGLAMPAVALAQSTTPPTDPQQGTPNQLPSTTTIESGAAATNAQPDTANDIVVTGVRASLERSIAIKRNSFGVVDAISAEDIGKFPDTNLAESLQRITGVSINRVNGEGSTVTVRGFGAQYNLVTLNGRQIAASNVVVVGGDQNGDGAGGFDRSFNFANLSSEGVKTLEVYKTGRAAVPSGGIGAAINVVTRRPLDAHKAGLNGSIGVKADYDTSADQCISCGAHVTPEVSGLLSWSNQDQTFGVSVFGSYQKRNFTTVSQANNDWSIRTYADFVNPANGLVNASTKINNAPSDPNTLTAVPDDARYHFSEDREERINGQAVLQFKPTDSLSFTIDGLYAQDTQSERRSTQSNWFNRPFDVVTFDSAADGVASTQYLHEVINGVKDEGFEQAYRAVKNRLWDVGLNAKWDLTHNFSLTFDGHIGKAESLPNNPNGVSSTTVAFNAPVVTSHSLAWDDHGFPIQSLTFNDGTTSTTPTGQTFIKGNNDGKIDLGDLSGAVQRQFSSTQSQKIKEARIDAGWDLGGGSRFDFGGDYRKTNTVQTQYNTRQVLGDWGNSLPPDIASVAPGQVFQYCLVCLYTHNTPVTDPNSQAAFRTEDATKLYNALYNHYIGITNDGVSHVNNIDANVYNQVKEDIWAAYGQVTWKGTLGGANASVVAGVRYENTKVNATSLQTVPLAIVWTSDNDFAIQNSTNQQALTNHGSYDNVLPSLDFQVELKRNLIGRFSASRTIARPQYGSLFASTGVGAPGRPTAIGGVATGNANDTNLKPLLSDNLDLSLEYYFKKDSYISVGFFDKRVHNFLGTTQVQRNLFGLRDPTSGVAGSRSGTAKTQLTNTFGADITDVNLFTYTALLTKNNNNVAATNAEFAAHYNTTARALDQGYVDQILGAYDVTADANDPLFTFSVSTPINNKDAEIYGAELAGQYFFGNTGIGVSGSYTLVRGNVGIDNAAPPTVDQFALLGLSDTYNVTLIYDKYGISGRLAYNWRAKFLSQTNRDSSHNPIYTAPFGSLDVNVSYDITPRIAVSFEGINLLECGTRTFARDNIESFFGQELSARYLVGARFRF